MKTKRVSIFFKLLRKWLINLIIMYCLVAFPLVAKHISFEYLNPLIWDEDIRMFSTFYAIIMLFLVKISNKF